MAVRTYFTTGPEGAGGSNCGIDFIAVRSLRLTFCVYILQAQVPTSDQVHRGKRLAERHHERIVDRLVRPGILQYHTIQVVSRVGFLADELASGVQPELRTS